jgi:hypothetical protein
MALSYTATLRNNQLAQITTAVGTSGKIRIYSGARPANADAAITGTILAELPCSATFAPAPSGGVLTASAITQDSSADASGTASHFRLMTSANAAVMDGDVGQGSGDLSLNSTAITAGGTVAITSFVITAGNA